jgi:hypothetical protein
MPLSFVRCTRAGSSARLERSTDNRKVAGSNPARPTTKTLTAGFLLSAKQKPNKHFFSL